MLSRVPVHTGSTPRNAPSTVNEVVNALQKKLTALHVDSSPAQSNISPKSSRRPSFSMDNLLHHKKDKKREDSRERDARGQKRISLTMRHSNKSKDRHLQSPRHGPAKPGHFENIIESPPLVLYGNITSSTGALLSGRLKLLVEDPSAQVKLDRFTMVLKATTTTKKPVGKDCKDCSEKTEELKTWTFLSESKTFHKDSDNQFPYSFLFPGHLPATTQSQLATISYALHVTATTSHAEKIEYHHPLTVQRAIQPGPDKASIRIFPPTNLTGRVQLPPVVHPIGTFPVTMSLSGVVEKKAESQTRWRLRKLSWRVEEHSKVISTPCTKHVHKVNDGKSIQHSETRTLGNDELKTGWKSDFDTIGGEINLEFEASLATRSNHRATCDVDSNTGIEVKHNLVLELIVAEEFCPNKNTQLITPTGAARVLRMQFGLVVTERGGMGISWDEEMPPVYDDVPASPPGYGSADKNDGAWGGAMMEDYHGPALEYEDLESMNAHDSNAPPSYRNSSLPRRRPSYGRVESGESSSTPTTSRRPRGGWTTDELGLEPQYALRVREEADNNATATTEDFAEGSASASNQPQN